MGPESKLYQDLKKETCSIVWNRIENLSIVGMPDVLGYNINHRFFASEKIAQRRFDFEFPEKNNLIPLLVKQDESRTLLCYGKPKENNVVNNCIKNLFEIKKIIEKEVGEKI